MSEKPDPDSKTEEATEKRIRDALEKGNVPHSRELVLLGSLAGMLGAGHFLLTEPAAKAAQSLRNVLASAGEVRIELGQDALSAVFMAFAGAAIFVGPIVLLIMALGVVAALAQSQPRIVGDRVAPKFSRVSPLAGFKRLFGFQGQIEFAKALIKLVGVSVIAAMTVAAELRSLADTLVMEPTLLPAKTLSVALRLVTGVTIAAVFLVAADLLWSRIHWLRELRMTRREVKDEFKEMEGDPAFKARRRSVALQRRRNLMIQSVPKATLVVANPTHFAVALRYRKEENDAPVVVAKGQDKLALRIREIAESHGVPVVEDKMLARSLYKAVAVDQMIHPEFYKAVAELILMVQRRRERRS